MTGYRVRGRGAIFLRDLGGIKIAPNKPFYPAKYKLNPDAVAAAAVRGHLAELLRTGELVAFEQTPEQARPPELYESAQTAVRFARRHKLVGPLDAEGESDFIERLQAEFGSGDSLAMRPEGEIARNTEKLINTIDFDGLSDPLEDT